MNWPRHYITARIVFTSFYIITPVRYLCVTMEIAFAREVNKRASSTDDLVDFLLDAAPLLHEYEQSRAALQHSGWALVPYSVEPSLLVHLRDCARIFDQFEAQYGSRRHTYCTRTDHRPNLCGECLNGGVRGL